METKEGKMYKKSKSRKKVSTRKLPSKPKRPLSAYNHFFREERIKWKQEDENSDVSMTPQQRFTKMGKDIALRWSKLSDEERAHYKNLSKESYRVWNDDMKAHFGVRPVNSGGEAEHGEETEEAKVEVVLSSTDNRGGIDHPTLDDEGTHEEPLLATSCADVVPMTASGITTQSTTNRNTLALPQTAAGGSSMGQFQQSMTFALPSVNGFTANPSGLFAMAQLASSTPQTATLPHLLQLQAARRQQFMQQQQLLQQLASGLSSPFLANPAPPTIIVVPVPPLAPFQPTGPTTSADPPDANFSS